MLQLVVQAVVSYAMEEDLELVRSNDASVQLCSVPGEEALIPFSATTPDCQRHLFSECTVSCADRC